MRWFACYFACVLTSLLFCPANGIAPIVVNTWPFVNATAKAWSVLTNGGSPLDALVEGCSVCEVEQCDGSVGYGGSPDTTGETTLDAMVMDGDTLDVGSVGFLRNIKEAIAVARAVLEHSRETLLAGDGATAFAELMGFKRQSLETNTSTSEFKSWKKDNCQPNYYNNVKGQNSCGPWTPQQSGKRETFRRSQTYSDRFSADIDYSNHDTIGMAVIGKEGKIMAGTTTNGASHKIHGRIGDSPIAGAGAYADSTVGAAVATGDGDVMMRLLPTYQAVESMRRGLTPKEACEDAILRLAKYYPSFVGAVLCIDKDGNHAGAGHGWTFKYSVVSAETQGEVQVVTVSPI